LRPPATHPEVTADAEEEEDDATTTPPRRSRPPVVLLAINSVRNRSTPAV
jgi:hypothetical protein